MGKVYILEIKNKTGTEQNYTIFSNPPVVSGGNCGPVWSNVLGSASCGSDNGVVSFQIPAEYHAFCGNFTGEQKLGSIVSVGKHIPVTLGTATGIDINNGSTIKYQVPGDTTSGVLELQQGQENGEIGSFELVTGNDFTSQNALDKKLLVGIAISGDGIHAGPMACFVPQPGYSHQLSPSTVLNVVCGSTFKQKFPTGALVDFLALNNRLEIDFNLRQTNKITIIHDEHMQFVLPPLPPPVPEITPTPAASITGGPATTDHVEYYSITIQNKSGIPQDYALYNEPPTIKPAPKSLTSRAILVAHGVASGSGTAFMSVPRNDFYALSGSGYQDGAVQNFNLDRRPVNLGFKEPGTTCVLELKDEGPLSFVSGKGLVENNGDRDSFSLRTGDEFTDEEAKNKRFIVALGVATSATLRVGTYASFVPSPITEYQIKPSKVFYISTRNVKVNQPKPQNVDFANCCKVDFGVTDWDVLLIHGNDGELRISDASEVEFP